MLRSLKFALLAGLALALAGCEGCSTTGGQTTEQSIATACAARATAVESLVVANDAGKLTAIQQTQVLRAIKSTEPVCNPADGKIPTLDAVKLEAFNSAVLILQSLVLKPPSTLEVYEPLPPTTSQGGQEILR